jgi:death-on-curing protein
VTEYLSVEQILEIHSFQLEEFGGRSGVRDLPALESAAARPAMSFGGEDLYPDMASKTGSLFHSLVMNHPFVDGNKRTAAHAALVFLMENGWEPTFGAAELVDVTMSAARGEMSVESLTIWFRQRIVARP